MSVELLVGFASTIAAIVASTATLGYWLGRRFERIEEKLKAHDEKFENLEKRMNESSRTRREFTELGARAPLHLIEFMALKGSVHSGGEELPRQGGGEDLIAAYSVRANPLSPEEARFILEVLKELREKPAKEIDISKLDKALEIADKWFKREGIYEAAKLWINLYTLRAITLKERGELYGARYIAWVEEASAL
jgi:hypothetical protein